MVQRLAGRVMYQQALLLGLVLGFAAGYMWWYGGMGSYVIIVPFALIGLPIIVSLAERQKISIWQLSIIVPAVSYGIIWYLMNRHQLNVYDPEVLAKLREKYPDNTFAPGSKYLWYKVNIFYPVFYFWLSSVLVSLPGVAWVLWSSSKNTTVP